ncbi:MAG: hypothetical protein C0625_04950 [Arcobacter sp.]|nr:MAG: hypothetical protein C0625_04950 [Arcobacter sp.]
MKKNVIIFNSIILIVLISLTITILSLYNLRTAGIKSAIHNAESISEVVKSGLTSHMINDNMNQVKTFMNSVADIKNIEKLWLVRSPLINEQFGNKNRNIARDNLDKQVLNTGKMAYEVDESITKTSVRVTIPYNAVADKGIDCLKCHVVKQGSTLGAVSLILDISVIKEIGIKSLYIISFLILITVIGFLLFSKKILTPYFSLYNNFRINMRDASKGNYKEIIPSSLISKEMRDITDDYNKLMVVFKETVEDIEKKLQGFVGHKVSNNKHNPLTESKDIITNLSDLYQFKKQVELDNTKEEIYARISQIFLNKFNIKKFSFIEIDSLNQKSQKVQEVGSSFHCNKIMEESPEECRAFRTKHDVVSIDFHNSCPYFENKEKSYYCINIDITKNLQLIINFVCDSNEELELLKDKIIFIKSYLAEAAPSLEVKLLMDALKDSAFRDGLTGLYNRKFFEENSKKLIPQVLREEINIGVLMLDMDHFKAVNDEYGHDIGDKVLKELSRILTDTVRESDVVIRYGGEEFVILLVGVKTEEDALAVANKIGKRVRENEIDVYAGNKLKKTVSLGLSMFPQDSTSFDSVVKNADIALYEAKNSGRDKVVRFTEEQVSSVDLF